MKLKKNNFIGTVKELSGVNPSLCWHCLCCSGGCPFYHAMDIPPNAVLRLVQLGLKEQALKCSTIWVCVGCYKCVAECPQAIDIAAVMDVLRAMAIEQKVTIAEPDILGFHKEVLKSIKRYGRTHKLEIMLRYKLRKKNFLDDMNVGLKMLAKRKLDLLPSKINKIDQIKNLFKR